MTNYMQIALSLAKEAMDNDEVPVGAVIVHNGQIIAQTSNAMRGQKGCQAPFSRQTRGERQNLNVPTNFDATAHTHSNFDATAHAEILCIRSACEKLQTQFLVDCDLYVTLEPCPMCAGAISNARIRRVFFGAYDPKGGGVEHGPRVFAYTQHVPEVFGGIEETACSALLKQFFEAKRNV